MIDYTKARKFQWLGHTLRDNGHIQVVLEGIVPEKKGRGWHRINGVTDLWETGPKIYR